MFPFPAGGPGMRMMEYTFDVVPGTVLVADFREQPALSSDSQDLTQTTP